MFERGGTFRGNLFTQTGVTYSAYGTGNKPEIYGSLQNYSISENWKETGVSCVYVYDEVILKDVGLIVFNNGEANSFKKVIEIDGFTGDINELKNDLEMYHDKDDRKVYLYSDKGNPAQRFSSIEFCQNEHIIKICGDDITIDNLCVKYGGAHGMSNISHKGKDSANTLFVKGLTVKNCEFGWIGGSLQFGDAILPSTTRYSNTTRYGNAIQLFGGFDGFTVENCYVYQIYDAGLAFMYEPNIAKSDIIMNNARFINNLIEYCTYSVEYFLGNPAAGYSPMLLISNVTISDNICRLAGYGWGYQRNYRNESAHIQSHESPNPTENFIIENNIFDRSRSMLVHISSSGEACLPKMKENTYIQLAGGQFGRYKVTPTDLVMFNDRVGDFIAGAMKEQNPTIRYTLSEGMKRTPFGYMTNCRSESKKLLSFIYTTKDDMVLPLRVILPDNYDKDKKYPLVLYLHSQFDHGSDNISQIENNNSIFLERLYYESNPDYDCVVIVPQCPQDCLWVDTPLNKGNYRTDEVAESKSLTAVINLIKDVQNMYSIDVDRIYAVGYSMGGYGVWDIAARHPGIFAAIIPVAGAGDTSKAIAFKNTAVWAFHGQNDYIVNIKYDENMISALETAGVKVKYTAYSDVRTECWEKEDLLSWLFSQK